MQKRKASANNIPSYYNYQRAFYNPSTKQLQSATNRKGTVCGYLYWLSNGISPAGKEELSAKYGNIIWFTSSPEYAPELKKELLFVADKMLGGTQ